MHLLSAPLSGESSAQALWGVGLLSAPLPQRRWATRPPPKAPDAPAAPPRPAARGPRDHVSAQPLDGVAL
eukprot:5634558-Pyramimonas_sp.AAC.1